MLDLEPPYYAVIINTVYSADQEGYFEMAVRMATLGQSQPGYLGRTSMSDEAGAELTVIYYRDEASIRAWKADAEHLTAQRLGKERWYSSYDIQVARVERRYAFNAAGSHGDH
ncbi:Heme-degrading monooxygenase HmoA [Quadrisphaera granulorum]|uniref:Heme-degrading monooxygenase HmoA n=1 Tax=Quadrisphaera granulorum TaxID=317664 RepID=A0A315ZPR6_9ACTN|nr:antibiotic biosynthesis monooxygenase [Quadrisphaera granulorum]PWJ47625.1 heme-degrading monooxygenase HmoA [Quadrisphaera granulorum]SZE98755.1 Heme-degrading monooxygenase HmoA [Quadrisphaera granulorum]